MRNEILYKALIDLFFLLLIFATFYPPYFLLLRKLLTMTANLFSTSSGSGSVSEASEAEHGAGSAAAPVIHGLWRHLVAGLQLQLQRSSDTFIFT